ncbi:sulfurtransferase complex subunit TusC [Pelagibaculum spongiae]|uniref:Sulfurtransferase complex subunit TusC n=1 Tax=Pelagibaculum spongiae TaxID=2080658 RepID=A0A2V1H2S9_9GAMM|nr:sulfurtransferase complex subunit TusC [Pelagibaculum spongiae]PVZ71477.1 sulfurtransferase complex subunit TusC [Pelagibaculum spongiae]
MKKFLFIHSQPQQSIESREGLDALMVAAAFDQDCSLLFLGQGLLQLKKQQNAKLIDSKAIDGALKTLPFYDVEEIYVASQDLLRFGLTEQDLLLPVKLLDQNQLSTFLTQYQEVLHLG